MLTRQDSVRVVFFEEKSITPQRRKSCRCASKACRPRFAYSYRLIDDGGSANGDGQVQRG